MQNKVLVVGASGLVAMYCGGHQLCRSSLFAMKWLRRLGVAQNFAEDANIEFVPMDLQDH